MSITVTADMLLHVLRVSAWADVKAGLQKLENSVWSEWERGGHRNVDELKRTERRKAVFRRFIKTVEDEGLQE